MNDYDKLQGIAEAWERNGFGNIEQDADPEKGWYLDCRSDDNSKYSKQYKADYCYHIHLYTKFIYDNPETRRGVALFKQNSNREIIYDGFLEEPWDDDDFLNNCDKIATTIFDKAKFEFDPQCLKKSKHISGDEEIHCTRRRRRRRRRQQRQKRRSSDYSFKRNGRHAKRNKDSVSRSTSRHSSLKTHSSS
jgi:hypothetical protein